MGVVALTLIYLMGTMFDLRDLHQRFTFDIICKITFGYELLLQSLPDSPFPNGFEVAVWAKFRPQRLLDERKAGEKRKIFVAKDPCSYPVFQAGPRICLGKNMALLQINRVVACVLRQFRVVPETADRFELVFLPYLTGKWKVVFRWDLNAGFKQATQFTSPISNPVYCKIE